MNDDPCGQFFQDAETSFGFLQGASFRVLKPNGIIANFTDRIEYYIDGVMVAHSSGKTLMWIHGCSKRQDKLISVHFCLHSN